MLGCYTDHDRGRRAFAVPTYYGDSPHVSISRFAPVTGIALSFALLAGCANPPLTPSGNPTAPNTPAASSGPTNTQGASSTATPAPAIAYTTLSGQVTFQGKPWANAKLQVFDAVSGNAAAVAPATGTLVVDSANLTTDANGNFTIHVSGLANGAVARVVATSTTGTLSALVTGSGGLAGYHIRQNDSVAINALTTVFDKMSAGLTQLAGLSLKSDVANTLVNKELANYKAAVLAKLESAYNTDPSKFATIVSAGSNATNTVINDLAQQTGITSDLNQLALAVAKDVANEAQTPANRNPNPTVPTGTTITFPGSTTSAIISTSTNTVAVSDGNGNTQTITLNSSSSSSSTNTGGGSGGSGGGTTTTFGPTISALTYTRATSTLHIGFTQNQGDADVTAIYTRIPTGSTFGTLSGTLTTSASAVQVGATSPVTKQLKIDDSLGHSGASVTLPNDWGGTALSSPDYDGYLVVVGSGAKVASFEIFKNRSGYDYLVTQYLSSSAVSSTAKRVTDLYTTSTVITTLGTSAQAANAVQTIAQAGTTAVTLTNSITVQ